MLEECAIVKLELAKVAHANLVDVLVNQEEILVYAMLENLVIVEAELTQVHVVVILKIILVLVILKQ